MAEAVSPIETPEPLGALSPRLAHTVARLAAANYSLVLISFVTGPLQARALGPAGRGDLATIIVPASLVSTVASLGLGSYAVYATALGRNIGDILGTIGSLLVGAGLLAVVGGIPLAHYLAGDRDVVFLFLMITFALTPVTLVGVLLLDIAIGAQDWSPVIRNRVTTTLVTGLPIPVLYVAHALTVTSAAIAATAGLVAYVFPIRAILRRRPRPRWNGEMAREGLRYGVRSWLGGLTQITNLRLDQLLMVKLVSPSELGLYVVAVGLSSFFIAPVMNALTTGSTARIAQGEAYLVARNSRATVAGVGVAALAIAAVSPIAIGPLFGAAFSDALPATLILAAASVPAALNLVFTSAITSVGKPGIAARAELLGVLITVPGLLLLLGPLGIAGAALVSIVAYSLTTGFILRKIRREFGGRYSDYLLPRAGETRALLGRVIASIRRVRAPDPPTSSAS